MMVCEVGEVLSRIGLIPVLSDARLTEVSRDDDDQIEFVELQMSHIVRHWPDRLDNEKERPSKKTVVSQHLVRFEREYGRTTAEYFQVGPPSVQSKDVKFRHFSPSFRWSVVGLMKDDKAVLQIWLDETLQGEVELSDHHGEFCTDEFFGWTGWDEDAGWFMYQAEAAVSKPGKQDHRYLPSFGEALPNRRDPRIFIFDLKKRTVVHRLDAVPGVSAACQIVYVQSVKAVYLVGYEQLPKRYGMSYCLNRPCHIFRWLPSTGAVTQVTSGHHVESVYYPVHDPDNQRILFFGTFIGGSHYHAFSLYELALSDHSVKCLVSDEAMGRREDIPGLFPIANPPQTSHSGLLLITSYLRTQKALLSIRGKQVITATPQVFSEDSEEHSWRLHQVHKDIVLASCSSRISPPRLYIGLVDGKGDIDWHPAEKESKHALLSGLAQETLHVQETIDVIITKPAGQQPSQLPLIIFPHGGPNYAYVTEWSLFSASAALLGYAVAAINYTGSAGYGMKAISTLEGQVGILDVNDCLTAVDALIATGYNPDRLFLYGGSHGGFLVAHLSCRPERQFKACVALNAVIDMPNMSATSDIPDFCWGQNGLPYDLRCPAPPNRGELEVMRLCSPSSRVHLASCPTLVVLGENDLRVPASQGIAWHTWLKARGIPTEAYMYPGTGHAIDSEEGEYQELYQSFLYYQRYP